MKINKNIYIPLVLLVISFLIRILLISKGPYHIDTLQLVIKGQTLLDSHRLEMRSGLGFPLTVILSSAFILLTRLFFGSDPVFAVNLMSVVSSSLSILFFYLIIKELFDIKTALFSSILFSLSPIFIGLSVYGKSHTPCLLFLFISLYYIVLSGKTQKTRELMIGSVFIALMAASRIIDMFMLIIPISIFIFWKDSICKKYTQSKKPTHSWKTIFIFWLTSIPVILIFYVPYFLGPHLTEHKNFFLLNWRVALTENFMGFFSPRILVALNFLNTNTTPAGLILAILGLVLIYLKNKPLFFTLAFWIFIPLLSYGNLHTTVTSRYFVLLLPALYICIGFALSYWSNQNKIKTSLSLILFLYILIYSCYFMYPALKARHENAVLPSFAQWTEKKAKNNATIICGDESLFFRYYTNLNVLGRPMDFFSYSEKTLNDYKKHIDALLDENQPVYIHSASLFAYNKNNQFSDLFFKNYKITYIGTHPYEDWHKGEMELQIYPFDLFKVEKKF